MEGSLVRNFNNYYVLLIHVFDGCSNRFDPCYHFNLVCCCWVLFEYLIKGHVERYRKVSNPYDWMLKCSYRFFKQGKSEGYESCDRPIVRKRPIWVKIGDVLSRVTLKFDGWPCKTIGHLSFAVTSFVQHFIAIGEFKLELQSENTQFGSNSMIFRAVWPWNLTYDLEKQ